MGTCVASRKGGDINFRRGSSPKGRQSGKKKKVSPPIKSLVTCEGKRKEYRKSRKNARKGFLEKEKRRTTFRKENRVPHPACREGHKDGRPKIALTITPIRRKGERASTKREKKRQNAMLCGKKRKG